MQPTASPAGSVVPRSRYLLVITVAALIVGALQAADVIELPFGAWFSAVSGSLFSSAFLNGFMTQWGYLSLFALMALESASLPVPSEVVLPLAGYFVYVGTMNFWAVVAVSTAASITGALVDYYLAVWLGRPFVVGLLRLFRLHRGALDRAEAWFEMSGQWTVFAARFVPGLRTIISLPAGLFRLNIWRFVVMTLAGCFAWSVVLVYAGFLAGSSQGALNAFASSTVIIDYLSGAVAAMSAAYIAYYFLAGDRNPTSSSVS
ncbi:MAG: DedA family protein [Thaumarchaeota archaeon]|nr:DedA family protein [Nitrososphaerota archaeon]